MIGYIIAVGVGYGLARAVDNPDKVRAAADAASREARKVHGSYKAMRGKEGSSSGRRLPARRR